MSIHTLGKFEIKSGVVVVSDPCYDSIDRANYRCRNNGQLKNVMKGQWYGQIDKDNNIVSLLICYHEDYPLNNVCIDDVREWKKIPWEIAVDSGQAGIFDKKTWRNDATVKDTKRLNPKYIIRADELWYSICCDRTSGKTLAGVIPCGVVSTSGYGDGGYNGYYLKQDGKIVTIAINFGDKVGDKVGDENEDDDKYDEDDDEYDEKKGW